MCVCVRVVTAQFEKQLGMGLAAVGWTGLGPVRLTRRICFDKISKFLIHDHVLV